MTQFQKEKFSKSNMYLSYILDENNQYYKSIEQYTGKFVARFKHQRSALGSFQTFLIKNFTVEEYFGRITAGEAPLTILQSKGYILPHIKKWLKEGGYPVTQAGYAQFMKVQSAISDARMAKAA